MECVGGLGVRLGHVGVVGDVEIEVWILISEMRFQVVIWVRN